MSQIRDRRADSGGRNRRVTGSGARGYSSSTAHLRLERIALLCSLRPGIYSKTSFCVCQRCLAWTGVFSKTTRGVCVWKPVIDSFRMSSSSSDSFPIRKARRSFSPSHEHAVRGRVQAGRQSSPFLSLPSSSVPSRLFSCCWTVFVFLVSVHLGGGNRLSVLREELGDYVTCQARAELKGPVMLTCPRQAPTWREDLQRCLPADEGEHLDLTKRHSEMSGIGNFLQS